jgi:HSP20 family protein
MNTLVRENRDTERVQSENYIAPRASVTETGEGYTLDVEMPGVNKEGLEISVENNQLTITGRRSLDSLRIASGKLPAFVRARSVN